MCYITSARKPNVKQWSCWFLPAEYVHIPDGDYFHIFFIIKSEDIT